MNTDHNEDTMAIAGVQYDTNITESHESLYTPDVTSLRSLSAWV